MDKVMLKLIAKAILEAIEAKLSSRPLVAMAMPTIHAIAMQDDTLTLALALYAANEPRKPEDKK